ncbi:MAG: toprim domain-containing protein, partial [Planctomycetes bacterium]|nr:toprim domain-containing protein [Planctomycetota bacterium]
WLETGRWTAKRNDGSGFRDDCVFIDRVTVPIHDERGRAVAFGGRILPDSSLKDSAKYLNGSESPVFVKSRLLYGLDIARDAVKKAGTAIVVEGYTDCMMIHQHGIGNAVATLGTALVESHVQLLRRFARKVVLVFDGDDAGQKAAERSLAKFLSQEVDLRILTLPAKQDPADYLSEQGADAFRQLVADAAEAWDYKFRILEERFGLTTVDGRHQVLNEMVALFAAAPRLANTVREDMMLGKLARKLGLPERTIRQQIKEARKRSAGRRPVSVIRDDSGHQNDNGHQDDNGHQNDNGTFAPTAETKPPATAPVTPGEERLERELLEIIFAAPETIERISGEITAADIRHPELRTLLETCFEIAGKGLTPAYERVTSVLEEPALKRLAADIDTVAVKKERLRLDGPNLDIVAPASLLNQVLDRLKWRRRTEGQGSSSELLQSESSDSGSLNPETKALLRRMTELRQADPTMKHRLESGRNR